MAFLLLLFTTVVHADLYRKWGYVQARGQVLGPNDQPVLVEVDPQGNELQEIGEVYGPLEGVFMMSAGAYRAAVAQYNQLIETQQNGAARGAVIVGTYKGEGAQASEYESYCQGLPPVRAPAPTPDAQPVNKSIPCPPVDDTAVRSVVLRHPTTILDPDLLGEDGPILLKSPIDLRDREEDLADDTKMVLLTPAGRIARQAAGGGLYQNTVTYKWNYFQPDAEGNQPTFYDFTDDTTERVLNPLQGVKIDHDIAWFGSTQSDASGKYRLEYYLPPCPCFTYDYNGKILGEVPYKNFNPKSRGSIPFGTYTVYSQTFDFCNGMAICPLYPALVLSNVTGILSTQATPRLPRQDLKVDAMMLTGEGILDVPVAETAYDQSRANFDVQNPGDRLAYDFDGDRRLDRAVLYNNEYYVYLGGRNPEFNQINVPINEDLRRRPDRLPDFEDRGLLKSISLEDLEQTDLYVFRASTGQLILERLGLKQDEVVPYNNLGADSQNTASANFFYKFLIRGPRGIADLLTGSLNDWWSKADIKLELFEQNKADFLRTGELVQIVAINRPTGYIGSVTAPLQLNNENDGRTTLDVPIDQLRLGPPNLKIRAERQTQTQLGLTQGEINQYLIGSEGSGLQSDQYIKITTEWFGRDGTPLPADLPGYTGLLAKVVGPGQVAVDSACGSRASKIPVEPGVNLQLLKLNTDCDLSKEHYYLYVCGNRPDETEGQANCFDFGRRADGRPSRYVPVKVPVFDEIATRKLENTYRYARQDDLLSEDAKAPEPVYQWVYRPEMQFSVFELQQATLEYVSTGSPAEVETIDLLTERVGDSLNLFDSGLELIALLYDLLHPQHSAIQPFGPDRELILSVGEDEHILELGSHTTFIENLAHLAQLDPVDFVTISLYQNNDAANVLWRQDLQGLSIATSDNPESDAVNSFVITTQSGIIQTDGTPLKFPQDPFVLQLLDPITDGSEYDWEIKVPYMEKYGTFQFVGPVPATGAFSTNTVTENNVSRTEYIWRANNLTDAQFRLLKLRPVELTPRHTPATYCGGGCTPRGGTTGVDVQQKNSRYTYEVKVSVRHANVGSREYKATIKMDWLDVIRQEYINHGRPVQARDVFTQAVATTNYTATSNTCEDDGISISCLRRVSGNYHADATGGTNYTIGKPLEYAEEVRTQYNVDVGFTTTPIITSAWRNPERNEIVGGSKTSNHQHGAAIDLIPVVGVVVYDSATPDAAANTWCQLAASAYAAGNARETLVENTRGAKPNGVNAIYDFYDNDPVLANCVSEVRGDIEACLANYGNGPYTEPQRTSCSPNHVHTARQ